MLVILAIAIVPRLIIVIVARAQTYPNPMWIHAALASMCSKLLGQTGRQSVKAYTSNRPQLSVPSMILTSPTTDI